MFCRKRNINLVYILIYFILLYNLYHNCHLYLCINLMYYALCILHCHYAYFLHHYRSTSSHEIGSDKGYMEIVNEVQKPAMTAVAKLVWEDTHNKLSKIEEETNVESLSLAFENIYYVPFDIIEKYSPSVKTLDLSNNRFSR